MTGNKNELLSNLLIGAVEILDMPDDLLQSARLKYQEVGQWLGEPESELFTNTPKVYPQGSMRLGTMISPFTDKDEYDVDLVCLLDFKKENISQKELKKCVGQRLRQHPEYRKVLGEGRRCWTLDFKGQFHMDILPSISDQEGLPHSILITDKELVRWQHSNPKGYATWFQIQMKTDFDQEKQRLARVMSLSVEEVPNWKIKTPLQRSIQLLKRHRDVYFQADQEDKPISIIISTLAAKAYENKSNLSETLVHIVDHMHQYLEVKNGVYWVENPVNKKENFADKWQVHPKRQKKFFIWIQKIQSDIKNALDTQGIDEVTKFLSGSFGKSTMINSAKNLGIAVREERKKGNLFISSGFGSLSSSGNIAVKKHQFYGD